MARSKQSEIELPGQDSFLDILANIVGILILLVMVVGIRVSYSSQTAPVAEAIVAVSETDEAELAEAKLVLRQAVSGRNDLQKKVLNVVRMREEALLRDDERIQLSTYVAAFEDELEQRREELSENQQREFELRRDLADSHRTLEKLIREKASIMSAPKNVREIKSYRTPLAVSSLGTEVHVLVRYGRVTVMPWDALIDAFMGDIERGMSELREKQDVVRTLGPIGGFRLTYLLEKVEVSIPGTTAKRTVPNWLRSKIEPVSPNLGETVEQAVRPDSDFWTQIKDLPVETTMITMWAYTDSFEEVQLLKEKLYDAGFTVAVRPKKENDQVGFSPYGTKSMGQ